MKNDFIKTNLFSCPIYRIRIDPNLYDKEEILKDIKYNKSLKNTRNDYEDGNNYDIHHSFKDYDNENFRPINYEKLITVYREVFQNFFDHQLLTFKQFKWKFNIVNYTAMTEGQWLPSHNHSVTDDFATVHYLNFKDDHVLTRFINPATFAPFVKSIRKKLEEILDEEEKLNHYLWDNFSWKVEEDDMIIFPSILNHEIPTQGPTEEPRITISTNIKINEHEKSNN